MTLRQLLTHAEKLTRDMIEHVQNTLLTQASEYRDLTRPVRRKSHYPKFIAVQNTLRKLLTAAEEANVMADLIREELQEIREHSRRERINRM